MNTKQKQIISTMFPELIPHMENPSENLKDIILMSFLSKGKDGERGEKGDTGQDGKSITHDDIVEITKKVTPIKGKDYFTEQEVANITDKSTPVKGRDYFTKEEILKITKDATPIKGRDYFDGTDNKNDDPLDIANKLNTLKDVIDVSVIKGAVDKKYVQEQNKKVLDGMIKEEGRIKLKDQRWHGGGLSSVHHDTTLTGTGSTSSPLTFNFSSIIAGSGITITDNGNGTITITSTGGGGGVTTWTQEIPSGSINGSNTAFTLSGTPVANSLLFFWNGQMLKGGGVDYTLSGTTVTMVTTPQTGDKIIALYPTVASGTFHGETPSGTLNGSNTSFTLSSSPDTNSLSFSWNGQILTGGGIDYTLSGTIVTMVIAPQSGDILQAEYTTSSSQTWKQETPTGTVNGSNVSFTLSATPASNSLALYVNGQFQASGGVDYTLSGAGITFVSAPLTGSILTAIYQ